MFSGTELKKLAFVKSKGRGKNHTIGKLLFGHCPASSQDRDNFCSSQEESWLGPGGCSQSPHVIVTSGEKGVSSGEKGFLPVE